MQPAKFNLLIPQGTDYAVTIELKTGPVFRTEGAAAGAESIPLVTPLPTAFNTGQKINFDGKIATIANPAALGAKLLSVEPLLFELKREDGQQCLDLTGGTATAKIWQDLDQTEIATLTADISTAPTEGRVILTLPNATTSNLTATAGVAEYPTEAELQALTKQGDHYLWQFHFANAATLILRPGEGFVVVSQKGV